MLVLGIDASLTATGLALVDTFDRATDWKFWLHTVRTQASDPMEKRLALISKSLLGFVGKVPPDKTAMEGFSFGDRFRQRDLGGVQAVIRLMVYLKFRQGIVDIPPRNAKVLLCPDWSGFNKKNWEQSGRKGPFKRSMPDKVAVGHALHRRWRVNAGDEHQADAGAIALALLHGEGLWGGNGK